MGAGLSFSFVAGKRGVFVAEANRPVKLLAQAAMLEPE
jgi:hypothetical protein